MHAPAPAPHPTPQVADSPASTKRSFLERKGLTAAEVEEAFRRAPAAPAQPAAGAGAGVGQAAAPAPGAAQTLGSTGLVTYQPQLHQQQQQQQQQQYPQQPQQPQQALVPHQQQQLHPQGGAYPGQQGQQLAQHAALPQQEPIRWSQVLARAGGACMLALVGCMPPEPSAPPPSLPAAPTQVVLGVGVLATGVYAVKSLVLPYVQDMYRRCASPPPCSCLRCPPRASVRIHFREASLKPHLRPTHVRVQLVGACQGAAGGAGAAAAGAGGGGAGPGRVQGALGVRGRE